MPSDVLQNTLLEMLKNAPSSPFLFVGSGFSRRYFGLPQWDELLEKFCKNKADFQRIMSTAEQNLPKAASILADEYHYRWWEHEDFKKAREDFFSENKKLIGRSSALRMEISKYVKNLTLNGDFNLQNEVDLLKKLNLDGVITTNWDDLLEKIYPDHKVYVGQNDLLFSNSHSVGEIYKIHGCISNFDSLVLTEEDYSNFKRLNPYLAAKLITIFVEHPIIFIGYSMSDKNIQSLLHSIVLVLDQEKLTKLSKNLIFIHRCKKGEARIGTHTMQFEERVIPVTNIYTDDYSPIYRAISQVEKKIPVRLLRMYKQQFYEIVNDNQPSKRMHVVDVEKLNNDSEIQFVVGLTVASEAASKVGYTGIKAIDLFNDLLSNKKTFRGDLILSDTIPFLRVNTTYIPIFKYLKDAGILNLKDYQSSKIDFSKNLPLNGASFYQNSSTSNQFLKNARNLSMKEIINKFDFKVAASYLPFVSLKNFDKNQLENFLINNSLMLESKSGRSTIFRKLACFYDWRVNGFDF